MPDRSNAIPVTIRQDANTIYSLWFIIHGKTIIDKILPTIERKN